MKKLFEIVDIIQIPKAGVVITGNGVQCDTASKESIKQSISSKIVIKFSAGKEQVYEVKEKMFISRVFRRISTG